MSDPINEDDPKLVEVLFRYRIIADAVEASADACARLLADAASKTHTAPDGSETKISLRTLQRWAERYRLHKLDGLRRKKRKDKGRLRAVTDQALLAAIARREEENARSTPTLIDILERADLVAKGALKRSTLDRHLDSRGKSRRLLGVLGTKRHVRLSFSHPLDFVVADFHHGPYVRTDTGEIRRARLSAFIDHCSRYVPESRYELAEDLMGARRGLRMFVSASGLMQRLYVDRGPGYQARRFHFACAQLGIDLVHSKPYVSEGRGVVERFNRTTKESFEIEVRLRKEPPSLHELNLFWRAWLEERYHQRPHSETGEPPAERWQRLLQVVDLRRPDPVLLDEVLRLHARRKVHTKTSTVEICGVLFVVDTTLRRRKVDVLYDPDDLSSVLIYFDRRRIQRATPQIPGESPLAPPAKKTPPPPEIDYLALLARDHERRRAQDNAAIHFHAVNHDDAHLSLSCLCQRLRTCCGRTLGPVENEQAAATLHALAPIEIAIADCALKTAVAVLGPGLHASQYLEALRAHVLRVRRKGTP